MVPYFRGERRSDTVGAEENAATISEAVLLHTSDVCRQCRNWRAPDPTNDCLRTTLRFTHATVELDRAGPGRTVLCLVCYRLSPSHRDEMNSSGATAAVPIRCYTAVTDLAASCALRRAESLLTRSS